MNHSYNTPNNLSDSIKNICFSILLVPTKKKGQAQRIIRIIIFFASSIDYSGQSCYISIDQFSQSGKDGCFV